MNSEKSKQNQLTVFIQDEDYTVGNLLRFFLNSKSVVELAACTTPHPSVPEINFRLQTVGDVSAIETFRSGIDDAIKIIEHTKNLFNQALASFMN